MNSYFNLELKNIFYLCEKNNISDNNVFHNGFWNFINENKNISNNILDINFGYKSFFHIQSLFTWFKNSPIFCFKYKAFNCCSLCNHKTENINYYNSFISINEFELNVNRIEDIIYNKFATTYGVCENCSYDDEKKIKSGSIYDKCVTHLISDIEIPNILTLCFEFSEVNQISNYNIQHLNLIKYRDIYTKLIRDEIIIFNQLYKICAFIFMPNDNHYSSSVFDVTDEVLNCKNAFLYSDGVINNGLIKIIHFLNFNDLMEKIKIYNIVMVLYIKHI